MNFWVKCMEMYGFGSGDLHMFTDPDELTKYIFV